MTNTKIQFNQSEEDVLEYLGKYQNRAIPGGGWRQAFASIFPHWLRPQMRITITNLIALQQGRLARKMADSTDIVRLNLGCGELLLDDYINIDLIGFPIDVALNLSKPLPFEDNSVDVIFHEHVIEHLSAYDGYLFLKECHRVLKKGGILRIVCPDASRYMRSYFDENHEFFMSWRGMDFTPMMELQYEFYNFGHKAVYDYETLEFFCETIGFLEVEHCEFGESRLSPAPDCEWRIKDSVYVEAVK